MFVNVLGIWNVNMWHKDKKKKSNLINIFYNLIAVIIYLNKICICLELTLFIKDHNLRMLNKAKSMFSINIFEFITVLNNVI